MRAGRCPRLGAWAGWPALVAMLALVWGGSGPTAAQPPGEASAPPAVATVTIAAEDDWAPYASVMPGNPAPQGFAVDLVRLVFASQGVPLRVVGMPFARCMFLAKTGEVAGCFNATIVDDNRADYHWHETPMFQEELAIFARADNPRRHLGLADLEGQRVGYTLAYTYPAQFRQNPKIHKVSAKSDRVLLEMLRAGRVDYVLLNTAPAYWRMRVAGMPPAQFAKVGVVSSDGFWVAFTSARPEGQQLARSFERGLRALRADGRYAAMQSEFRQRLLAPATAASGTR